MRFGIPSIKMNIVEMMAAAGLGYALNSLLADEGESSPTEGAVYGFAFVGSLAVAKMAYTIPLMFREALSAKSVLPAPVIAAKQPAQSANKDKDKELPTASKVSRVEKRNILVAQDGQNSQAVITDNPKPAEQDAVSNERPKNNPSRAKKNH